MNKEIKPLTNGFTLTEEGKVFEHAFNQVVEKTLEEFANDGYNTIEMEALAYQIILNQLASWRIRAKLKK